MAASQPWPTAITYKPMEAYRIALEQYSRKLVASGAPNRWNTKGQMVLYAGGSRSLATLELVVHRGVANPGATYKVMVLHIADDDNLITQIKRKDLPPGWRSMAG
ncbi:MAG: RES domain-containing protein, partial [Chitinophagia bacterium]|nr:RES domain-containing protein [Chitinophagia bacterium]